jgi:bifunctional non-homologous end joining protein LigD
VEARRRFQRQKWQIDGRDRRRDAAPAPMKKKSGLSRRGTLKKLMQLYPTVQLATLVDEPPQRTEWLHEIKLDGYRLLGFVAGGALCFRTRNGKDWTAKFPSLAASLERLKVQNAVLDMEAVVVNETGKSNFQALQAALGEGGNPDSIVAYVFDVLYLNGRDLTKLPLRKRKENLQALLKKSKTAPALRYSEHIEGNGGEIFAKACSMGLEGIVSKQAEAPYLPGRQRSWLKSKCAQRQEFIIIGYSDPRKGERALGALYLGYHTSGRIKYAGKVGTGFTMESARSLSARLKTLSAREPVLSREEAGGLSAREWQSIHWVKPVLLCEVDFTEWTKDGQLRHPSFQGLREDKDADDVKKEKPLQNASPAPAAKMKGSLVLHGINITHPDRVISEIGHITKGDLAEYYAAVAPFMLPRICRHPLSLLRCPAGIDGQCFYQRNPGKGLGPDVHPFKFKHKGKSYKYLYIKDEKGLLELVQMGAIEIHPWGASIDAIDCPDRLIFDLDPAPDVPFEAVKRAAQDLRRRLKRKGLESMLKCTGGKGLHVTVPLASKEKWPEVKSFAAVVANEMVETAPETYVATMTKTKRKGKIFVDYFRNDYTATAIADYAVRARPGAPVALPLEWKELRTLKSASQFTIKDVLKRLARKGPPAPSAQGGHRIPSA